MNEALKLTILSPERRLVESVQVSEVTLPGSEGQIQVLPGHAPMLGTLETGVFAYRTLDGATSSGILTTGFFEVNQEQVKVMAETLELKGEIDLDRAQRSQKVAEEALKESDLDEHKFRKYQLKLQRSLIRQQLANKE